jgi:photosystem II stability/assembly factor-like uncharacterized protein
MLKKLLKFSLAAGIIGIGIFFARDKVVFGKLSYFEVKSQGEEIEGETNGIEAALDFFQLRKANPKTGQVDMNAVNAAYMQADKISFNKTGVGSNLDWVEMGPDNIGGRCRAIIIDKDSNNVIYAAGVTGGVFKSLDAGSTWKKVCTNPVANQNACALTQSADGSIYYGTGEAAFFNYYSLKGSGYAAPAYAGQGVFKSTDHGATFQPLTSTKPNGANTAWSDVSALAADPTDANRIYAGNDNTLMISKDGGVTWTAAGGGLPTGYYCKDIKMTKDGNTIYVVLAKGYNSHYIYRSYDKGTTWTRIASSTTSGISTSAASIVLAIAPSNESIIYASVSATDGSFMGVYKSLDKGDTWTAVALGDANHIFNPFAAQGGYDNAIAVDPLNSDKVYVAGLNMFSIEQKGTSVQTSQLTDWSWSVATGGFINSHYIHADQHLIIFDHAKPYPNVYIGTDGGVSKSSDISNPATTTPTFNNADFGFNTTQFYGIGVGADAPTNVIGGAQDNGTVTVKKQGITLLNGEEIHGGDGGYCEISKLNPSLYFGEYVQGSMFRSFDQGKSWNSYFDKHITPPGTTYSFVAWFSLWESANDPTSVDSVVFNDPIVSYKAGQTIAVRSANGVDFPYLLKSDLPANTSITVKDPTQSKFFVVDQNEVWMTRDILNKSITPIFFRIATIVGFKPLMVRSAPDGNTAFVAGIDGSGASIYRITGLSGKKFAYSKDSKGVEQPFDPNAWGIKTQKIYSVSSQVGTCVAVDENNGNHILFGTGTYDAQGHIYVCNNALDTISTPSFSSSSGNLPSMPIYDVLISSHNPKLYLAGTDFGVYSSFNSGTSWSEENRGMERVPVSMLRQMKYSSKPWNGPYIFASTFGRGVFYTSTLTTGIDQSNNSLPLDKLNVNVFPNPARNFTNVSINLPTSSEVSITLFDMQGKVAGTYNYNHQVAGDHVFKLETSNLKQGTYFINIKAGAMEQTSKMMILGQ